MKLSLKNIGALIGAPFTAGASLALLEDEKGNSLLGELTGSNSAKQANKQNIALQKATNEQAIELANTAHQREVLDLQAAGLNPVLSAGGTGATTPTLGTAQVQNELPGGYIAQAQNAVNIIGGIAQAKNLESNSALQNAQTQNTMVDTQYMPAMKKAEIAAQYANAGSAKAQADYTTMMKDIDADIKKAQTDKAKAETTAQEWENTMNRKLGTSKNEWGPYRAIKNTARSLFDYNPLIDR